jgi:hypothetical protein
MALTEVIMYRVVCDRCGASAQDDMEYYGYAWLDPAQAIEEATNDDWLITPDGGHYCRECVIYDDGTDEYVPNPEPVKP